MLALRINLAVQVACGRGPPRVRQRAKVDVPAAHSSRSAAPWLGKG